MRLFLNTIPDTLWSGVSCLRYARSPCLDLSILTVITDSLVLLFSDGPLHVAQLLVV
jgi:hypothetical protein